MCAQVRPQVAHSYGVRGKRDYIGHENVVSLLVLTRRDEAGLDVRMVTENGGNFTRLDAHAADFHLIIQTT
ncbi:MAG: hypothetical protein A2Y78_01730 [Acidobacteria bacterium RBG_13_68_16]|nr:MAG: hypothetical protein A2Y78_01730 [Acidobacteria bacterium RBG_13_68_16]